MNLFYYMLVLLNIKLILSFLLVLLVLLVLSILFLGSTNREQLSLKFINPLTSHQSKISFFPKIPPFSLDSIFSTDHSWVSKLPQDQVITLITTGDVIPARSVNWKMTTYQDFTYPFAKTAFFLKDADVTLINLEAPLIPNCPVTNEGMVFCGNQRFVEGLSFAGIDVVNLANNHTGNWETAGLYQTKELLEKSGVLVSGLPLPATNLATKKIKGVTFGFLGFNLLDNSNQLDQLLQSIRAAKQKVDFLIVSFHWGTEYQRYPNEGQRKLAYQVIDAGADLLVGNHPHWFQPTEIYKDKLIVYAHGNFIFDQEWSQETKTGIIGKYTIYQGRIVDAQFFPIFIQDYSQPYFLEGEEKEKVLEELKIISLPR